jgi:hypothetical protein
MGEELTVSCASPNTLPTVALMAIGPPTLAPRARPLFGSTVATDGLALLQVAAGALATRLPRASRGVAANCCVVHRGIEMVAGNTETLATTCWTVTPNPGEALATWFEVALAVTCAAPFATAVRRPLASTVATAGASLLQLNAAPATGLPPPGPASRAVAISWTVSPRLASEAEAPPVEVLTDTVATTCATATDSDPLTPFEVALIAALPFPSAVTSPDVDTLATAGKLLDQVKVTLAVTSPCLGLDAVAESWTVWFRLENEVAPDAVTLIVST